MDVSTLVKKKECDARRTTTVHVLLLHEIDVLRRARRPPHGSLK